MTAVQIAANRLSWAADKASKSIQRDSIRRAREGFERACGKTAVKHAN
jgi:hypothetical protein